MTGSLAQVRSEAVSCTYQHMQGQMLIKLNRLASEISLSHSEYRIMAVLIGLWNKKQGMAFPTIEYLANICCMGKQTVIKALNNLVKLNLLIVARTPGKRNNYYFSNQILDASGSACGIHVIPPGSIACNTAHDMNKQNRTNRKTSRKKEKSVRLKSPNQEISHNEALKYSSGVLVPQQSWDKLDDMKDDDVLKNTDRLHAINQEISHNRILKYSSGVPVRDDNAREAILMELASWNFIGGEFVLRKHSVEKIKRLLEIVKEKNPANKGAYFRSLLNLGDTNIPENKKEVVKQPLNEGLESVKKVLSINEARLSREEIINKLFQASKIEEAQFLCKLWKI